jgi:hypothetical protein
VSNHVVLIGDSVFDNAAYVPGELPVIEQLRAQLPDGWRATLLAIDGASIGDVARQLERLPRDATHLVLSIGGNDALADAGRLDRVHSLDDFRAAVERAVTCFRSAYSQMLDQVRRCQLSTVACTIYDRCPFADPIWRQIVPLALAAYNDCILDEATTRGMRVIELRSLCTEADDYSALSPIEPSAQGGMKIVEAIVQAIGAR